jgi:hypothetical protein
MKKIIDLLYQKNHFLEKFYSINEKALESFLTGNYETIESFYESREKILEIIKHIDQQITQHQAGPLVDEQNDKNKKDLQTTLAIKNLYVEKILAQDLEILACIEHTKNSIITELRGLKKGKKAVAGYKSPDFSSKIDKEL